MASVCDLKLEDTNEGSSCQRAINRDFQIVVLAGQREFCAMTMSFQPYLHGNRRAFELPKYAAKPITVGPDHQFTAYHVACFRDDPYVREHRHA